MTITCTQYLPGVLNLVNTLTIHHLLPLYTGGECGKKPGHIKPFEALKTQEMKKELQTRNWKTTGSTKKTLTEDLKKNLKGVQRVPSLLLTNPTEPLENLNLQHYQILDCEPLHDLKGHLSNLLQELPTQIEQPLSGEVRGIIECDLTSKETKRGGDYRLALIHIVALLRKRDTPQKVLQLMETALEMSEIMYTDESKRSPQLILKLYNTSWVHFELCKDLLSSPKTISHTKMFGMYIHSLCVHAPVQYEIINLKSTNTEHEERLFGQAKEIAHRATNRQPNNIVPNILLRLQAKQKTKALYTSYQQMCVPSPKQLMSYTDIKIETQQSHIHSLPQSQAAGSSTFRGLLPICNKVQECGGTRLTMGTSSMMVAHAMTTERKDHSSHTFETLV